jgi:endonuclease/exonuclease/phosphatase family metal-dependent hydrolase
MALDLATYAGDSDALAASVRAAEPDVVAVFGAPRFLRWRSKRAALARRCGLLVATADRPGATFLMASMRAAVVSESFALLPLSPGGRRRSVVSAVFDTSGVRWRVAAFRLGRDAGERATQAAAITAALFPQGIEQQGVDQHGVASPLIVAADLAEPADGPLQAELRDRLAVGVESGTTAIFVDDSLRAQASAAGLIAATVAQ